ncbi:Response regulator of zinc sigma-54-dependent two-component system [Desulfosporosinus sp. I2]|uniref:sigma-54 interaction domain-containing protein n=1 Tax=Desulfosporosinus sp. I2 TaxID=1617025 RepID=UPI00061FCAB2|nr:sigma 54-interacting transcriptional regulator [Desulfosporosinus sp. I2]KJR46807.1 Response regulator of zinc sigma-54-dependent two-component system [Desulfosporosinus sp. I2]
MFRAFSNDWKLEDMMIKPVTTIEPTDIWREIYVKMECKPVVFLQAESAEVWQVIFPLKVGQERTLLGFSYPLSGTFQALMEAIKFHPGETAVLLDSEKVPQGVIEPSILTSLIWEEIKQLSSSISILMDTVNDAVTVIDQNNTVIGWNKKAEDLYGIAGETIIGEDIQNFFSSLVVTHVINTDLPKKKVIRENYHQPLPGTHVLINASSITCGDEVIGSVCAEKDITEIVLLNNELSKASSEVRQLKKEITKINRPDTAFSEIAGHSKGLQKTVNLARRVANTNAAVMIRGESGTGKELFAEAIHKESSRRNNPFVVINCGAIPASLFESELFGYQSGAFTGADRQGRQGKFEAAHKGTVFLDEIGEMPLEMQVKLLRVLQNKCFYRVGGNDLVEVDVRVIAATHRDLEQMIREGSFRKDLYYRINVVGIEIPPLRQRKEDILDLIYLFIREFCLQQDRDLVQMAPEVMPSMLNYPWPGNVRELRNVVERMVILAEEDLILEEHLPETIRFQNYIPIVSEESSLNEITDRAEREIILQALKGCSGDKSKAARKLGVPRSTLYYKMKKFEMK